ncbi:MAG TPA: PQQ-binding-like beta-propeller repeat protein [Chloroflexia bacterium]
MKSNIASRLFWCLFCLSLPVFVTAAAPSSGVKAAMPVLASYSQATSAFAPGDWPMYGHDPAHTSYNPDESSISAQNVQWLVPRWQSPDLGSGASPPSGAPTVANGKVFIGSSAPEGNNFFAFDAVSGAPIWAASVGYMKSCFNVGIGATSAVSGTMVVTGGADDAYYALDTETGARIWRDPMDVGPSGFAWVSPLLAYGRAYVGIASACDDPSVPGEVRAIGEDGTKLASARFVPEGEAGAGIWNSPALSPDGRVLVVATGEDFNGYNGPYNRAIVSLDPITLDILQANQQGELNQDADFGTSPIIFHDNLGRTLVGAHHKGNVFYAYDLHNINAGPVWTRSILLQVGMLPAYNPDLGNGGTLFILGGNSRLYALDPATGKDRWPDALANGLGNMAIANGLIFLNDQGTLRILDETNGHTLRVITPENSGPSYSGVAVAHGFVYWLSGSRLNAWSIRADVPGPTPTPGAGPNSRLFPETGFTVSGLFLDYWSSNGGIPQQGYPISPEFVEKSDLAAKEYKVQYFERAVFEHHPENEPPYDVLLSLLGTLQYKKKYPAGAPGQQPNDDPGSVFIPQTGKRLGGKFLAYWQTHGGLRQQGYPISDEFVELSDLDGKPYTVQYFERAVFEYHPENPPPYDVLLSLLGTLQFNEKYPVP